MTNFTINKNKSSRDTEITAYGYIGNSDYDKLDTNGHPVVDTDRPFESEKVYAVKVEGSNNLYYVRQDNRGYLCNPIESKYGKQKIKDGKFNWQLKKTTKQAFEFYLHFLTTKNLLWLNKASREN